MRKWGSALVLVWLLIHPAVPPQFSQDESRSWTLLKRLWHFTWNSNAWVATSAYDTKAECQERRDREAHPALQKLLSDRTLPPAEVEYLGVWTRAACLPAEAVILFGGSVTLDPLRF